MSMYISFPSSVVKLWRHYFHFLSSFIFYFPSRDYILIMTSIDSIEVSPSLKFIFYI